MKKAPWELNPENIARGDFSKFNRYMVFKRFLKYIKIGQPDVVGQSWKKLRATAQ